MAALHPETSQLLYYYGMAFSGAEGIINYIDYLYFRFTTISTLGHGDIHPTTGLAKMLAISEAFLGMVTFALVLGCVTKGLIIRKQKQND